MQVGFTSAASQCPHPGNQRTAAVVNIACRLKPVSFTVVLNGYYYGPFASWIFKFKAGQNFPQLTDDRRQFRLSAWFGRHFPGLRQLPGGVRFERQHDHRSGPPPSILEHHGHE